MMITGFHFDIHPTLFAIAAALASMPRSTFRTFDVDGGMLSAAACVAAEIRMTPIYGKGGGGILLRVRHTATVPTYPFRYIALVPQTSCAIHISSWVNQPTAIPPTEERMISSGATTRIFEEGTSVETMLRAIVEDIAMYLSRPSPQITRKQRR
jgi:hypothetical protein